MLHRLIVLAAGEGLQLDGFNKALIRHPRSGERVIEQYARLFSGHEITVVVGYRAIEIMHRYPALRYVYNSNWRLTGNAYSLGLALDDRPCIVLSADLFMDEALVERLRAAPGNAVLAADRGNRTKNALNLVLRADGSVEAVYQGAVQSDSHPEAPGVFKVQSASLLRRWKQRCLEHSNLFALQNLPLDGERDERVFAVQLGAARLDEVNTPLDYLNLMERER
jgi:choline kinase